MTEDDDALLDLMNSEITARLARQSEAANRLDTKATLLLGFVVTAVPLLVANGPDWRIGTAALVAYIAAFISGVFALRLRDFQDVPEPRPLTALWDKPKREVLGALVGTRLDAFDHNREVNDAKAWWWHAALVALVLGAALTGWALKAGRSQADARGSEAPCGT